MAKNAPSGDGQRRGMVKKRSQLKTKVMGEKRWTKRSRKTGEFMDQKADGTKFKGVRREKPAKTATRKTKTARKTTARKKTGARKSRKT